MDLGSLAIGGAMHEVGASLLKPYNESTNCPAASSRASSDAAGPAEGRKRTPTPSSRTTRSAGARRCQPSVNNAR